MRSLPRCTPGAPRAKNQPSPEAVVPSRGCFRGKRGRGGGLPACLPDGSCRTPALDAASKVTEQEWREKAKKDLEEWNLRQNEQMEKNRANNR